ncbi:MULTISPECIES: ArsR/SmtB family transcription factor [Nostocales]|uniref:ArsR/SmtB family transcription factor n=1 Tax=Nostocales TaxID=1161 RepID=UPI000CA25AB4|nr:MULTISPECIES: metalloregulator ArsR/SmtB family transcription factor [unclassified Nostoc]AUT03302.1 transcriptional regulator [Nostoc sp. CENA543]MCF4969721.1 transcriptional regulator [Nostoc sp. CMAA1605]
MPRTKLSQGDSDTFAAVADYFKMLSEASRLQILACLKSGPMNVMELTEATGLGQANLSKHLKVLTQAGIVTRQPKGTSAFYEIADPMIFDLCELACDRISERILQQAESIRALQNTKTIF